MKKPTDRTLTLLAAMALALAACGGGETAASTVTTTEQTTTTETEASATTVTTEAPATTVTTEAPATTTTTTGSTTTTVPGEAVDFGPASGDVLGVVGVSHDDVLNVRSGPGVDYPILTGLDPTEDDVVAKGSTWSIPGAFWIEVEANGVEGWVNLRYVAYLGETNDITAQVIAELGETPEAETMLDLGLIVAEAVLGDSETSIDPVMSVAPAVGDLGEVTYDVLGVADDSVSGFRLHVFATPSESGEGFILKSIEATTFCARGLSEGLCL
jgi:hypothetical protein